MPTPFHESLRLREFNDIKRPAEDALFCYLCNGQRKTPRNGDELERFSWPRRVGLEGRPCFSYAEARGIEEFEDTELIFVGRFQSRVSKVNKVIAWKN